MPRMSGAVILGAHEHFWYFCINYNVILHSFFNFKKHELLVSVFVLSLSNKSLVFVMFCIDLKSFFVSCTG